MGRLQKVELPQTDPLWKAVKQEQNPRFKARKLRQLNKLSEDVTDMLETGGEIQLRDREGKLQPVKIRGLD